MSKTMTAAQINDLKAKIKAEMKRRSGYGSLSTSNSLGNSGGPSASAVDYSGTAYDFTTTPTTNGFINAEHG